MQNKAVNGFTLIELIVTVSIVGIITALALPSFLSTVRNNQLSSFSNQFLTSINLARSEAIKRGLPVTLIRKSATALHWEEGWDIFIDKDSDHAFNDNGNATLCETNADGSPAEDCLFKTFDNDVIPEGYFLRKSGAALRDYISLLPGGLKDNPDAQDIFTLCYGSDSPADARRITISFVGRPRVDKVAVNTCP